MPLLFFFSFRFFLLTKEKKFTILYYVILYIYRYTYGDDGELYYEKVVGFLRILAQEWQRVQAQHSVKILFFSRTFFAVPPPENQTNQKTQNGNETNHENLHNVPANLGVGGGEGVGSESGASSGRGLGPTGSVKELTELQGGGGLKVSPDNYLCVSPFSQL